MSRLLDLVDSSGLSKEQFGQILGVRPLLLVRCDSGEQAMPARLATEIAGVLGVPLWQVKAACPLNTDLDFAYLYNPIPPRVDEPFSPVVVVRTQPVAVPSPAAQPSVIQVDETVQPGNIQVDQTVDPGNIQLGT